MLAPGTRLGVYEVVTLIGAGGMGEVYKAKDTRLDRIVAIKVLPSHVSADAAMRERFEREARTIAALNHPHICTLHDVGRHKGTDFLVLEYLEGQTLADRLTKGALPLEQALTIAIQIADALDKAHRAGIIHRDLKPGNVMLTKSGAKLLDFGVAKLTAAVTPYSDISNVQTAVSPLTVHGEVAGTLAYMAPEQIQGRAVDGRADIFAFGCVFYEMITGRRAFDARTETGLITSILEREPPSPSAAVPATPAMVADAIRTCLFKDPDERWQTARDLLRHLQSIAKNITQPAPRHPVANRRHILSWALTAVLGVALVALLALARPWEVRVSPMPIRLGITEPIVLNGTDRQLDIAPDGRRLVYTSGAQNTGSPIRMRSLDALNTDTIQGVESARTPFFSPTSRWIGYFDIIRLELRKISTTGGTPVTICPLGGAPRGATWISDDAIVFATSDPTTGLLRVSADGGEPEVLTRRNAERGELDHVFPSMLPDGRTVIFTTTFPGGSGNAELDALNLENGERKTLIRGATNAKYVPTGLLLYTSSTTLFAVPFDVDRLEVTGAPVPLVKGVGIAPSTGAANYSVSNTGTLVYVPDTPGIGTRSVVWVDRSGHETEINAPPRSYYAVSLSPDANRVAFEIREQDDSDVWTWDFVRQTLTRLTMNARADFGPIWTPDGHRIVFGAASGLFWQLADGTGKEEQLTTSATLQIPMGISSDGRRLISADSSTDLGLVDIENRQHSQLIATPATEITAHLSPNGNWLAYESNDSGQFEVYVRPFPSVNQGRWQVSPNGGRKPLWSRDGRELFYLDGSGMLTVVPIHQGNETFSAGAPSRILTTRYYSATSQARTYDVSPDGRRFIVLKEATPSTSARSEGSPNIVVVLNWFTELQQRVPTR